MIAGQGGAGKSFTLKLLAYTLRAREKPAVVLTVPSSGISAVLLPRGECNPGVAVVVGVK